MRAVALALDGKAAGFRADIRAAVRTPAHAVLDNAMAERARGLIGIRHDPRAFSAPETLVAHR